MNCKECRKDFDEELNETIRYIKSGWISAYGWAAGRFEGEREIQIDAGIFCSDKCLIKYLEE